MRHIIIHPRKLLRNEYVIDRLFILRDLFSIGIVSEMNISFIVACNVGLYVMYVPRYYYM